MEDLLQISNTDLSMQVLYYLFHPLLELLVGPNPSGFEESLYSQTFSYMFYIFNTGLIFLAGLYILLNSTMALLKTIDEGQVLGRSWSTTLVPLRLALGFAVLLPLNTGYSLLQSGAMWVGIQGIGLANSVYEGALERITKPSDFTMMTQGPSASQIMIDIYHASSCTYYANHAIENRQLMLDESDDGMPEFGYTVSDYTSTLPDTGIQHPVPFSGGRTRHIDYTFGNTTPKKPAMSGVRSFIANIVEKEPITKYLTWINQDFLSSGKAVAADFISGEHSIYNEDMCGIVSYRIPLIESDPTNNKVMNDAQTQTLTDVQNKFVAFYLPELDAFIKDIHNQTYALHDATSPLSDSAQTAAYFYGLARNFDKKLSKWIQDNRDSLVGQDLWQQFIDSQIVDGWMSAGTIYYAMVQINDRHNSIAKASVSSASITPGDMMEENLTSKNEKLLAFTDYMVPKMEQVFRISNSWSNHHSQINSQLNEQQPVNILPESGPTTFSGGTKDTSSKIINKISEEFSPSIELAIGAMYKSLGYDTSPATSENLDFLENARSPILVAQEWGRVIIALTSILFAAMLIAGGASSASAGGFSAGAGIAVMASGFLTIIVVTLAFFGLTLAYYIPMVPFITWLGALASLFLVFFEMLIVANIWGITWLSPEGEGFTGRRAEQGWLLILNVFLSPVLMVFGLFIAAALSFAVFAYINAVFFEVFNITQSASNGSLFISELLGFVASIVIYAIVCLSLISVIYSLIWQVRDNVLRWLGSGAERMGDMGVERENRTVLAAAVNTGQRGAMTALESRPRGPASDKDSGPGRDRS